MTIARILAAKGRDVITTQPHWTLAEVAEVFVAKNIGAVMVVDDQGSIIGILSERDIVRALAKRGASASMNTRRCENISRPLEVPGIRLWRPEARWRKEPSNIRAFMV